MNLFKRRNARTMMEDYPDTPQIVGALAGADAAFRDYTDPERRNESLLRRFGGGAGTSGVAPGTIVAMAPDLPNRVMTGVNEPGVSKVRTIGNEIVQPSDTRWSGEQVQGFMGTPPAKPAMASAQIPGSVAEQLLGPAGGRGQRSEVRGQGSPQPETVNREPGTLFYDENPIQTSANQPKQFMKMQADYWTNNVFAKARNTRPGFSSLAEYDAWFRQLPGNPAELGPTMKEAYLAGMPPNIQQEFMENRMRATTERREGPAAAAFSSAAGLETPVTTMAQAEAVKSGTAVAAQRAGMTREQATAEWDKVPMGQMTPVEGVPGWGFVKTSSGGGQLVEMPEEKKIPFDGRKSFTEDGVIWTWSDRSQSYMGRPEKASKFDIDPMIWLTMKPEQQEAMVRAFTSQKAEGEKPGAATASTTEGAEKPQRYYSKAKGKWYTREADGSVKWE